MLSSCNLKITVFETVIIKLFATRKPLLSRTFKYAFLRINVFITFYYTSILLKDYVQTIQK